MNYLIKTKHYLRIFLDMLPIARNIVFFFKLKDPSRWQPALFNARHGIFAIQQFVTPQNGMVRPYTFKPSEINQFEVGPHGRLLNCSTGDSTCEATYKETTDVVVTESTLLNDEKKLKSEFFDDKVRSILGSIAFTVKVRLSSNSVCTVLEYHWEGAKLIILEYVIFLFLSKRD